MHLLWYNAGHVIIFSLQSNFDLAVNQSVAPNNLVSCAGSIYIACWNSIPLDRPGEMSIVVVFLSLVPALVKCSGEGNIRLLEEEVATAMKACAVPSEDPKDGR